MNIETVERLNMRKNLLEEYRLRKSGSLLGWQPRKKAWLAAKRDIIFNK